jgi:hypothetical protein
MTVAVNACADAHDTKAQHQGPPKPLPLFDMKVPPYC